MRTNWNMNNMDEEYISDEQQALLDCDEYLEEEVETDPLQGLYDLQDRAARFASHPALSPSVVRHAYSIHVNLGEERSMSLLMEYPVTGCFRADAWVTNVVLHFPPTSMTLIDEERLPLEDFMNVMSPLMREILMLII